jgi:hypothetical protein
MRIHWLHQTVMSTSTIPLKRITLYKNDLGYFERVSPKASARSVLVVAKRYKKLVIDTLCTTASEVAFDTEEHQNHLAQSNIEKFYTFTDLSSTSSFATFLKTCIGAQLIFYVKTKPDEFTGKLLMVEENTALLSETSDATTTKYKLCVLYADGFIRHVERESNVERHR